MNRFSVLGSVECVVYTTGNVYSDNRMTVEKMWMWVDSTWFINYFNRTVNSHADDNWIDRCENLDLGSFSLDYWFSSCLFLTPLKIFLLFCVKLLTNMEVAKSPVLYSTFYLVRIKFWVKEIDLTWSTHMANPVFSWVNEIGCMVVNLEVTKKPWRTGVQKRVSLIWVLSNVANRHLDPVPLTKILTFWIKGVVLWENDLSRKAVNKYLKINYEP